jgi:hypothetical protein
VIISFITRVLFVAYFLEAGLILVVAPWSGFWEHNFFVGRLPALQPLLSNLFVRGAVSGIGAITAFAGLAELAALLGARRRRTHPPGPDPSADVER